MKILITGSNGLLGQKLLHKLRVDNSVELIATSMGANRVSEQSNYKYLALDITSKQEVEKIILAEKPDVVINTAAITNVDLTLICTLPTNSFLFLDIVLITLASNFLSPLNTSTITLSKCKAFLVFFL